MATLYEIDTAISGCIDAESGEIIDTEMLDNLLMERSKKLEVSLCGSKISNQMQQQLKSKKTLLTNE